jgi:hypothetical protein
MVAQRTPVVSDASQFDRIIVMPTTAAPRPAAAAAPPPPSPPAPFAQLNGIVQPTPDDDDQSNRLPAGVQLPPALAPIFNSLQQQPPQPGNPRRPGNTASPGPGLFGAVPQNDPQLIQSPNGAAPSAPVAQPAASPFGAVSTPGMIAPAQQQPGQVVPPGIIPGQPQRRSPNDN